MTDAGRERRAEPDQQRGTLRPNARLELSQSGCQIAPRGPVVVLHNRVDAHGPSRQIQGFKARPDGLIYLCEGAVGS